MTIRQISEVAGISVESVRRESKKIFPMLHKKGIKVVYNQKEAEILMKKIRKKNLVSLPTQSVEVVPQNVQVDYEIIGKMIAVAVSSAITPVMQQMAEAMKQINNVKVKPLELPAPSKSDRATFNQIIKGHHRITKQPINALYNKVYAEIYYRCRLDVSKRANNKKCSKIQIIEDEGLLPQAIAIAREILI